MSIPTASEMKDLTIEAQKEKATKKDKEELEKILGLIKMAAINAEFKIILDDGIGSFTSDMLIRAGYYVFSGPCIKNGTRVYKLVISWEEPQNK